MAEKEMTDAETATHIRAAATARREAIEECAEVCDREAEQYREIHADTGENAYLEWAQEHVDTADKIRSLLTPADAREGAGDA